MKSLVLLSGGVDSVTLLRYLSVNTNEELIPIMFDYGQTQFKKEKKFAEGICKQLKLKLVVVSLGTLSEISNGYIPARNSILIFNAVHLGEKIGAGKIYFGAIKSEENFNDCSKEYIKSMNMVLSIHRMELIAPFVDMDKIEVIKLAVKLGIDIRYTWSCNFPKRNIFGGIIPCDECNDCKIIEEVIELFNDIDNE